MANDRWERLAPASGLVFVALLIVQGALSGPPPRADDPTSKIMTYFTDHRGGILAGWYLVGLGVVFFFWFLGSLRNALARAEGGTGRLSAIAFGGGVALAAIALASGGANAALAYKVAGEGNAAVVRALFDFQNLAGNVFAWFPAAAMIIATSVVMIRTSSSSKWLGWAGLLAGTFLALVAGGALAESGPMAPGDAISFIAFILFGLWVLALSILMLVWKGQVARPAP